VRAAWISVVRRTRRDERVELGGREQEVPDDLDDRRVRVPRLALVHSTVRRSRLAVCVAVSVNVRGPVPLPPAGARSDEGAVVAGDGDRDGAGILDRRALIPGLADRRRSALKNAIH
jgi:hypothetical protein